MLNSKIIAIIRNSQVLSVGVASAATQAASIIAGILIARNLGVDVYGRYLLLQSSIQALLIVASFGNTNAVSRYIAIYRDRDIGRLNHILRQIKKLNIFSSALATTLLILYGAIFLGPGNASAEMDRLLWIAAPSLVFLTFDAYFKGALIAERRSHELAYASITAAIFLLVSTYLASTFGGIRITMAAVTVGSAFQCWMSRRLARRSAYACGPHASSEAPSAARMYLKYSLPTMLAGLTVQPVHWIMQNWLMTQQYAYQQIAIFGICLQWLAIVMFLPSQLSKVLLPQFSEAAFYDRGSELGILVRGSIRFTALYGTVAASLLAIFAPVIGSYYGVPADQLILPLRITAVAGFLSIIQSPLGTYLNSQPNVWSSFTINLIWAAAYFVAAFYLHGRGAAGFLWAMTIAYITNIFVIAFWISNARPFRKDIFDHQGKN